MRYLTNITIFLAFVVFATTAVASTSPYYVSIKSKSKEANVRTGPSVKYPIRWVYQRPNWPMQVTATFEHWRKVRDAYGQAGWIHETLLTRKRHIVTKFEGVEELLKLPVDNADTIAVLENNVIGELIQCKNQWCKVQFNDHKGWIQTQYLWGVDRDEAFE